MPSTRTAETAQATPDLPHVLGCRNKKQHPAPDPRVHAHHLGDKGDLEHITWWSFTQRKTAQAPGSSSVLPTNAQWAGTACKFASKKTLQMWPGRGTSEFLSLEKNTDAKTLIYPKTFVPKGTLFSPRSSPSYQNNMQTNALHYECNQPR